MGARQGSDRWARRSRAFAHPTKWLDSIPTGTIFHPASPFRGRSHETQTRAGEVAAPAGGARNPASGRPRPAVRPYYEGLPSMAGRGGRRRVAGAARMEGPTSLSGRPPGSTAPGTEKLRWSAERRRAFAKARAAARRMMVAPLGAPSPRLLPGAKRKAPRLGQGYGLPGAAKNTGADACPDLILRSRASARRLEGWRRPHGSRRALRRSSP